MHTYMCNFMNDSMRLKIRLWKTHITSDRRLFFVKSFLSMGLFPQKLPKLWTNFQSTWLCTTTSLRSSVFVGLFATFLSPHHVNQPAGQRYALQLWNLPTFNICCNKISTVKNIFEKFRLIGEPNCHFWQRSRHRQSWWNRIRFQVPLYIYTFTTTFDTFAQCVVDIS